jgi:cellobiose phosphorylase
MTDKQHTQPAGWVFIDKLGAFQWENPIGINELYFPVCNEAGMTASVTPRMHGDATTGQHSFLRHPLVMEDLHNTRSTRNFWIYSERLGALSLTGSSARQFAESATDRELVRTTIQATFLAHTLIRDDARYGVRSEITHFCPVSDDKIEITSVRMTNTGATALDFQPTTSFPIYGRSADNLRDHNHWTSLTHRMELNDYGLVVTPEIHHDEAGHRPNHSSYFVLACGGDEEKPVGQFPTVREFIGEGNFDWPHAVSANLAPYQTTPNRRDGMEAVGAIRFAKRTLAPGESCEYIVIEGVTEEKHSIRRCIDHYGSSAKVQKALDANNAHWKGRVERISFETADPHFDRWMRWVALQPILRKIYGNSFLPHFDYGRGGRGWRDLWQDCLALLLQDPDEMRASLVSYFDGIRLDGSNATIINKGQGDFAADRNRVSRVWMDHGVWPYFTLKLYIDQTGDVGIIAEERTYWKDHQICRAKARDTGWKPSDGVKQKTKQGALYTGSIIEHILVQHLTCFCNVGEHNNIKLEDADWNDLLDMANEKGETVPFTAFYGRNLIDIADLLSRYSQLSGKNEIALNRDILQLTGLKVPLDYDSPRAKQQRLQEYFHRVHGDFTGEKEVVSVAALAAELRRIGEWVLRHISTHEWIESKTGHGFFNGYYNNDGERVDGDHEDGPRMNLTGQTFAIMSGAATNQQVVRAYEASKAILKDPGTGGYRLTTPLGPNQWNFGRGFAVVYGEKETGGAFNHMIVMFLNGLYRRGFVREGYEVFSTIYRLANDTAKARIYPGIPEYINSEGQGKYHYLSGSASWLLMTMLTIIFGIRGEYGDLVLEPKLVLSQFGLEGKAKAFAYFRGHRVIVDYQNAELLDYGAYRIAAITVNNEPIAFRKDGEGKAVIAKEEVDQRFRTGAENMIVVRLGAA